MVHLLRSTPSFRTILPFLAIFAARSAIAASADTLRVVVPGHEASFTVAELKSKLKAATVEIDDPIYKARKSYDGFWLADVLKLAGMRDDAGADELVFTAQDGYAPNASFADLRAHRPFLAYGEHGKKEFQKIAQGKEMLSPAPYYVVWTSGEKELGEKVPWPYQLVKIEVVDFRARYPKMFPIGAAENSAEMRGFRVFKAQCIRCHSINLQGGEIGPELNAPKNVTEYWAEDTLKAFIRNPSSFRYKDKMPPFESLLKSTELDDTLAYLKAMKSRKSAQP